MSYAPTQEQRWDHARDLRKHDTLPSRLSPPIAGAIEVAILVKAVSLTDGAELIEQYARTKASEAALQATINAGERILSTIDAHGSVPDA